MKIKPNWRVLWAGGSAILISIALILGIISNAFGINTQLLLAISIVLMSMYINQEKILQEVKGDE